MLSSSRRKKAARSAPPLPSPLRAENIDARGAEVVREATGVHQVSLSSSSSSSAQNKSARRRISLFVFKGIIVILFVNFCACIGGLHHYLVSHAAVQSSADSSLRTLTSLGGASAARGFRLLFNQQYRSLFSSSSFSSSDASLNHGTAGGAHIDGASSGTSGVLAMLEESLMLAPSPPRAFGNHYQKGERDILMSGGGVAAAADASPIVVGSGEDDDDEDEDTNSDSVSSLGADSLSERSATSLDELELLLKSSGEGEGEEGAVIEHQQQRGKVGGRGEKGFRDASELSHRTDHHGDGTRSSAHVPLGEKVKAAKTDATTIGTEDRATSSSNKEHDMANNIKSEETHRSSSTSRSWPTSPRPILPPPTVVTVVGGGLAGLLCALETLHRAPTAIVVLVEGSSTGLGGRVANVAYNTDNNGEGGDGANPVRGGRGVGAVAPPMVEVGATFIHGVSDNPLTRLALHYGLKTRPVDYDSVMVVDADTGRAFSAHFVNEVKAKVYNVARSIFFLMRAQRSRQGLGDVPLDTLFEKAVGIALHGFGNTNIGAFGGEQEPSHHRRGSEYTTKNNVDADALSIDDDDDKGEGSMDAALPPIFRGVAGRKALYRTLRTDGPSLASAIQHLLHLKHFNDDDDDQHNGDDFNTTNNTTVRAKLLRNIQQVLSWHFYWEIVQDQIAPLNSLGSYAYDNSLGFRGPDHVFDNPRGIQALIDAIVEDMAVEGGAVVKSFDDVTTRSASELRTLEQDEDPAREGPTPTSQFNESAKRRVVVDYTLCEMVPAALREALVAYGVSDDTDGDEMTATVTSKRHESVNKKRRLILSVGCSIAQITDNQLPAVQQERRAEIQSILDNKRLAHRKELLGGSGIPTETTKTTATTRINANDAKEERSGSNSGKNKNKKENLQARRRAAKKTSSLLSEQAEALPSSVGSLSSAFPPVRVFDPAAALAVVSFYSVGICNIFDSFVWSLLSSVALPFATAVYDITLGLARVFIILSIEAWAYLTEAVTSASADSVDHQHRAVSPPFLSSSLPPACSLGDRLWSAFFTPSQQGSCSFSSKSAVVGSTATSHQSTVVFDAELCLAKENKQKENTNVDVEKIRPLPNLLPHHLRIAANEKQEMQNRFLAGEDPIPDRSEIMHDKRRSGTDKARAMMAASTKGRRSGSDSHPRNQKNRSPPSPTERDVRKRNGARTEGRAVSWLSRAFELVSAHSYSCTRVARDTLQRFGITFVRNVRRQYRRASRRAASPLNKLLFLAANPFAALKWVVLEGEPMTQALVAAGQVSVFSPIESTTTSASSSAAASGTEYTNSYTAHTPSSAYMTAVSNHLKERAKSGIRLHADSSLSNATKSGTSSTCTAGGTNNCWWDSDVVVVTVPLGVLQKSVGYGSVGARKPSLGRAASKKTTTGAARGEAVEETIDDESLEDHPLLVGSDAAAAPRRQQSIGRNTPQLKTSSPPPQERTSKQLFPLSDRSGGSEGGTLIFIPPLPLRKREAIASTGCSETLKIALQFRVGRTSLAPSSSSPSNTSESCGGKDTSDEDDNDSDEVFWPEGIDFFGIAAQKSDREHHRFSAGGHRNGGVIPVGDHDVDDLLNQPPWFGGASSDPGPPSQHGNKSNMSLVSNFEGTAPHSYLFGDAGHIEIVNLHKHRNRNGILIIEVENALARYWSSFANETLLIESEVMPRLEKAFCRTNTVKKEDVYESHAHLRASTGNNRSCCKVPRMPKWFSINNYLKNPHIRCGFSYWRPGRDGRDNLVLRAGLWPHGHAMHSSTANLKATASVLFSPTSFLSLQQHHASLKKGLVGPSTPQKAIARAANPTAAVAPEGGPSGGNPFVSSGVPSVAVSVAGRNRLLFAGEHTSPDMYGNMHGAIVEGQRAAVEVLAIVDHHNRQFYEQKLCFWTKTTVGRVLKMLLDYMWWAVGFAARGPQLEMASRAVEALI